MAEREAMLPRGSGAVGGLAAADPPREGLGIGEVEEKQVGPADGLLQQRDVERSPGSTGMSQPDVQQAPAWRQR